MTTQNDKKMAVEADRTADIEEVEKPAQAQIHLAYEATDVEPAVSLKTKLAILALGVSRCADNLIEKKTDWVPGQLSSPLSFDQHHWTHYRPSKCCCRYAHDDILRQRRAFI